MSTKLIKVGTAELLVDAIATLGGLIMLYDDSQPAANNYASLKDMANGNPYQVTTGKTLYVVRILIVSGTAGNGNADIGYGDTSVVNNSALAPTNSRRLSLGPVLLATNTAQEVAPWLKIPSQKFAYIRANGSGAVPQIWTCFEE